MYRKVESYQAVYDVLDLPFSRALLHHDEHLTLHPHFLECSHFVDHPFEDASYRFWRERTVIVLHDVAIDLVLPPGLVYRHRKFLLDLADDLDGASPLIQQSDDASIDFVDYTAAFGQLRDPRLPCHRLPPGTA
jgi:hypothetical protein